jgi:hypothetical protein
MDLLRGNFGPSKHSVPIIKSNSMKQKLLFVLSMMFFAGTVLGQTHQLCEEVALAVDNQGMMFSGEHKCGGMSEKEFNSH